MYLALELLTTPPELIFFLNISKVVSFEEKISVTSFISIGFLRSGLSVPYFSIESYILFLEKENY